MTEEKHLKKRNKNKKGKASVQKNTCVNEGHLTDLDPEEQPCVQADDKPGKKKRKERNVTECLDNARNDEEISKKKKKKKQVGDYEVEAPLRKIQGSSNKKKKKKSKCADIEHAEIDAEEEAPKKAEKKKNKPREPIKEKKNSTADESTNNDIDEKHVPKKHKKSKINLAENQETSEETGGVEEVKKNKMAPVPEDVKKTKKRQVNPVLVAESNEGVKKKNKSAKSGDINVEEEKKKKKARKTSVECADAEETKPRKNKTSKQDKQDEEQQREENLDTRTDRKHRKRKECTATAEAPEAPCSEKGTKRKKKKAREEVEDQQEPSQAAVGFLSVKNGNADEVTINQQQGRALQTETDRASQPPEAANPSGLGQWSTAQFDSSEKQQKFLRLMGGFKKGFQPSAGTTARANMALGKDGQQQLQQKLLDEFDRAHSRRIDSSNRGAGIGFTAPATKKFFIDINASRSVRFDD